MDYYDLRRIAKERKCHVADLVSMNPQNDPFYSGYHGFTRKWAEWFREIWQQQGARSGVHLRRLHYWLVSVPGKDADGEQYVNDDKHWNMMRVAGLHARENWYQMVSW